MSLLNASFISWPIYIYIYIYIYKTCDYETLSNGNSPILSNENEWNKKNLAMGEYPCHDA